MLDRCTYLAYSLAHPTLYWASEHVILGPALRIIVISIHHKQQSTRQGQLRVKLTPRQYTYMRIYRS